MTLLVPALWFLLGLAVGLALLWKQRRSFVVVLRDDSVLENVTINGRVLSRGVHNVRLREVTIHHRYFVGSAVVVRDTDGGEFSLAIMRDGRNLMADALHRAHNLTRYMG